MQFLQSGLDAIKYHKYKFNVMRELKSKGAIPLS